MKPVIPMLGEEGGTRMPRAHGPATLASGEIQVR